MVPDTAEPPEVAIRPLIVEAPEVGEALTAARTSTRPWPKELFGIWLDGVPPQVWGDRHQRLHALQMIGRRDVSTSAAAPTRAAQLPRERAAAIEVPKSLVAVLWCGIDDAH